MLSKLQNKKAGIVFAGVLVLVSIPVQIMNDAFADEQYRNSQRLLSANALFETNTMHNLENHTIYSTDLLKQKNALGIHDKYFEAIAQQNDIEGISFVTDQAANYDVMIFETGANQWTVTSGDETVVLSEYRLDAPLGVRVGHEEYLYAQVEDQGRDGDFYYYHFVKNEEGKLEVSREIPFENLIRTAGNTLQTANIEYGIYPDGWVEPEAKLQIATGDTGSIQMKGYYNQSITGNETIEIFDGDKLLTQYTIDQAEFEFTIPCQPNTTVNLTIKSDFSFSAEPPDIRVISFIITDLVGQ